MNNEALRYPTGKFTPKESYTRLELSQCIERIESLPARLESFIQGFSSKDFDATYRPGGWSARQVLHHISDSHLNAYVRLKWTLTESSPIIKAYDENLWAETPEVALEPTISLTLLKALHIKWVALLKLLSDTDLQKEYIHPETGKPVRIERMIALYAWHGDHHLGHLKIIAAKPR
jgi:hypothetical protein